MPVFCSCKTGIHYIPVDKLSINEFTTLPRIVTHHGRENAVVFQLA